MKVLLVNGSPKANGNTARALAEVAEQLNAEGIDTEAFQLGAKPIRDCIGCGQCGKLGGRCTFDDDVVNELIAAAEQADGFIFGSPVYYAHPSGRILSALDRAFYAGGNVLEQRVWSRARRRRWGCRGPCHHAKHRQKHGLAPALYRGRTGRRHQRTRGRSRNDQLHQVERRNKMIQIFGTKKSFDTKKAQRFFKERRIKVQFIDLKEKEMSKGELTSVMQAVGGIDKLLNPKTKDEETLALIQHLTPSQRFDKLLENQQVLAEPIVRNGKKATVGYCPDVWGAWE